MQSWLWQLSWLYGAGRKPACLYYFHITTILRTLQAITIFKDFKLVSFKNEKKFKKDQNLNPIWHTKFITAILARDTWRADCSGKGANYTLHLSKSWFISQCMTYFLLNIVEANNLIMGWCRNEFFKPFPTINFCYRTLQSYNTVVLKPLNIRTHFFDTLSGGPT